MKKGHVVSVMGPVVDLEFERGNLPEILNAVKIEQKGEAGGIDINLTLEVAVHLGDNKVRAVAMCTTDGLVRGMDRCRYRRTHYCSGWSGNARPCI